MPVDKEGNAYGVSWFSGVGIPVTRTYGLLEVTLNGKLQAGLVARPQLGGASFDVS